MAVAVYENFLDDESLEEVLRYFNEVQHSPSWINNSDFFPSYLNKNPGPLLVTMVPQNMTDTITEYYIDKGIFKKKPKFIDVLLYIGHPGSAISWHTDGASDVYSTPRAASSVYLTEDWQDEWGGYFLYKKDNELKAIEPTFNKAIVLEEDVEHCTTVLSMQSKLRKSMQIFFDKEALYAMI